MNLVVSVRGVSVRVPVLVQPESEYACLIGMNAIPLLGIALSHQDGEPIYPPSAVTPCVNESNGSANRVSDSTVTAEINFVSSVVVPSQKGHLVRAVMSPVIPGNN